MGLDELEWDQCHQGLTYGIGTWAMETMDWIPRIEDMGTFLDYIVHRL